MAFNLYLSLSAISVLILGLTLYFRYNPKIQPFFSLLLLLITIQLLERTISPQESSVLMTGIIGSIAGINLIISSFIKTGKIRWIIPIATIVLIFLFGKNDLMYGDYSLDFSNSKVTGIIVFGFLIGAISDLLVFLLKRFFSENEQQSIQVTAQLILTGLFAIPATFFASWYGFVFLSVGFFLYNSYSNNKRDVIFISLLSIASIPVFLLLYGIESVDLTVGKVIAGLITGAGTYALGILATQSTNKLLNLGLIFLAISSIALITLLNNVHPAYGGLESFAAAFIGMAVINFFAGKSSVANVFFPAFLVIGMLLPSNPFEEIDNAEKSSTSSSEEISTKQTIVEEPKGLDASTLSGKYNIVSETAVISFQLGPKGGITKGGIKEFEGTADFGNDINSAKFNVKLPTKKLTTFNSIRDESIMGGAYLNETKYPLMSFTSSKMESKEDGYLLKGNFTLLGKTNPEDIFIKYLGEKDGKQQFTGKASIDRTKYGMPSSPQEGNIVDFTFSIELK